MLQSSCEREKNTKRNNFVNIRRGGRGGGTPGAEIPLQAVEKTMVKQVVLLQSMENHALTGADS